MTQQTEKICFRYDGSNEADKALEIIKKKFNRDYYVGLPDVYYYSDVDMNKKDQDPDYTLVTPAEFLRLVKGEPEWTPKYGEEVEVSDNLINWHKYTYIGKNPHNSALPYVTAAIDGTIMPYKHIRPVRKSVREELTAMLCGGYDAGAKADEILSKFNVTPKH